MNSLLKVNDLKVHYLLANSVVRAVDGVTFDLKENEIFSLVGESGSGKSTLAYAIARLLDSSYVRIYGEIIFNGINLLELSEIEMEKIRGNLISMIPQDPSAALNPAYTVGEQIAEVLRYKKGLTHKEARDLSIELMKKVGIPDAEKRYLNYPHQLSGGMNQRVVIAIAMALRPRLIIADEPTSALDVTVQARILELLTGLVKEYGSTMLLITHDLGVAAEVSDRIGVMYAGKLMEIGSKEEILEKPLHPYTQALLHVVPRFHKKKRRLKPIAGMVPNLSSPPSGCRFHPRCPYRSKGCILQEPLMVEVEPGHWVSCNLHAMEASYHA